MHYVPSEPIFCTSSPISVILYIIVWFHLIAILRGIGYLTTGIGPGSRSFIVHKKGRISNSPLNDDYMESNKVFLPLKAIDGIRSLHFCLELNNTLHFTWQVYSVLVLCMLHPREFMGNKEEEIWTQTFCWWQTPSTPRM